MNQVSKKGDHLGEIMLALLFLVKARAHRGLLKWEEA